MNRGAGKTAVLIAGPTASGKSALALQRARALDGIVVNTDALQVYDRLQVLTARPRVDEMGEIEHHLYGTVPPSLRFTTGDWLSAAARVLDERPERNVVFVGGTGLYFDALINGFAEIPSIPEAAVAAAEAEIAGLDRVGRARLLAARDPVMAARLKSHDPQRVVRALSVLSVTGRSLASFQDEPQRGLLGDYAVERLVLNPPVHVLRERIAARFRGMMENGAVAEARTFLALGLDPSLPAMKAIGLREIGSWLDGRMSREEAEASAITATQQYAKRQRTWFRGRMADWTWVTPAMA